MAGVHAFDVLGDPVRRRILELLADGEQTSGAVCAVIQREFAITQPAVSQHLRVLREQGFATVRPACPGVRWLHGRSKPAGTASGTVEACAPPHGFAATWEYDGSMSWIELRLSPAAGGTRFELDHIVPIDDHWRDFGPGAVGVGWDLA